ncbi:GntR family transcriptional regulator [Lutibacter sp. A64]|uniref:GntR family transcriptional regulator n=1 Tax=Lutibacter sp. A64 TaxID=2918526 RepID=UPI001F06F129|nr:GntR family transcriptional regulator [Lutibacter sp. A64]UMB54096.1 GntR family transcriptional regulator [Lutibacter sp. A64]
MELTKFIKIDENSRVPKYQQIIDSIIYNISLGNFIMDQKIPSINMFSEEFYLSRDTVEKAYSILKERNIITSIRGKGFYISKTKLISKVNILFLVNKLSTYKQKTYNSFIQNIGPNSHTELHIYHCDENLFLNLLEKYKSAFDYFIIMPHFKDDNQKHISYTLNIINKVKKIPRNKLIILDNTKFAKKIDGSFIEIFQDFENDIYNALKQALSKIKKYKKIMLVYHDKAIYPYPRRILHGFKKFCIEHDLDFEILNEIYDDMVLKNGDLFITIEEADLVNLVKQTREQEFKLGEDIGIISYNDTPLKELLGITVISTDFKIIGQTAANMIVNNDCKKVQVPFNFIDRESL